VPTYNPCLHTDFGDVIIPRVISKSLRTKPRDKIFCIIAIILANVLNVGCHGFKFTSPMFDIVVDGEQNPKDESGSQETN
jgi:nitrate reductase NapE component